MNVKVQSVMLRMLRYGSLILACISFYSQATAQDLVVHVKIAEVDVRDPSDTGIGAGDEWYVVDATGQDCFTPSTAGANIGREMKDARSVDIPPGERNTMSGSPLVIAVWEEGGSRNRYACNYDPGEDEDGSDERLFVMRFEASENGISLNGEVIQGTEIPTGEEWSKIITHTHSVIADNFSYDVKLRVGMQNRSSIPDF